MMLATVGLDRRSGRTAQAGDRRGPGRHHRRAPARAAVGEGERASGVHYFPESGEEAFEAFLGVPIVHLGRTWGCWWSRTGRLASSTTRTRPSSTRSPPSSPAACCAGRRRRRRSGPGRCRAARRRPARRAGRRRGQAAPRHQRACAGRDRRAGRPRARARAATRAVRRTLAGLERDSSSRRASPATCSTSSTSTS